MKLYLFYCFHLSILPLVLLVPTTCSSKQTPPLVEEACEVFTCIALKVVLRPLPRSPGSPCASKCSQISAFPVSNSLVFLVHAFLSRPFWVLSWWHVKGPFPASCSVVTPACDRPLKWTSGVSSPAKIASAATTTHIMQHSMVHNSRAALGFRTSFLWCLQSLVRVHCVYVWVCQINQ